MVMHFILAVVHVNGPVGQTLHFFGNSSAVTLDCCLLCRIARFKISELRNLTVEVVGRVAQSV
jgi:hypothetical protein